MLVEKAGSVELLAYFPAAGTERRIRMRDYITERQERMMAQDPFMVRALARHVADDLRTHGFTGVEIRADSFASINGRPLQRLIDPRVDLARPISVPWIVPLRREIE